MDLDFCISTPQPNRYESIASQQRSGRKRRAPCSRFQSSQADEYNNNLQKLSVQNDVNCVQPSAKRFKRTTHFSTTTAATTTTMVIPTPQNLRLHSDDHSSIDVCRTPPRKSPVTSATLRKRGSNTNHPTKDISSTIYNPTPTSALKSPLSLSVHMQTPPRLPRSDSLNDITNKSDITTESPRLFVTPLHLDPVVASSPVRTPTALPLTSRKSNRVLQLSAFPHSPSSQVSIDTECWTVESPSNSPIRNSHYSTPRHNEASLTYDDVPTNSITKSPPTPQAPRRNYEKRKTLCRGIQSGNEKEVEEALENGEDPNVEVSVPIGTTGERQKMLPILAAAKLSTPGVIERLILGGAVPNSVNALGQTALHIICQKKSNQHNRNATTSSAQDKFSAKITESNVCVPESWIKLRDFLDSICPDDNSGVSPSQVEEQQLSNSSGWCTPKWSVRLPPIPKSFEELMNDEGFQQNKLLPTLTMKAKVLLKYGIDSTRKDRFGKTAADYAKENRLLELYNLTKPDNSTSKQSFEDSDCSLYNMLSPVVEVKEFNRSTSDGCQKTPKQTSLLTFWEYTTRECDTNCAQVELSSPMVRRMIKPPVIQLPNPPPNVNLSDQQKTSERITRQNEAAVGNSKSPATENNASESSYQIRSRRSRRLSLPSSSTRVASPRKTRGCTLR